MSCSIYYILYTLSREEWCINKQQAQKNNY